MAHNRKQEEKAAPGGLLILLISLTIGLCIACEHAAASDRKDRSSVKRSSPSPLLEVDYDRRVLIVHKNDKDITYKVQRYGRNARNDSSRGGFIAPGRYRLTSVNGAHALNAGEGFNSINCTFSIGIEGATGRSGLLIHDLSRGVRTNGRRATGQEYAREHPYSQGCIVLSTPDIKHLLVDLRVRPGSRLHGILLIKGTGTRKYVSSSIEMNVSTRKESPKTGDNG